MNCSPHHTTIVYSNAGSRTAVFTCEHIYSKECTEIIRLGYKIILTISGHFTQVVWKESKELGVAMARNNSGQIFVVANYAPRGNIVGTYTANVPPPK